MNAGNALSFLIIAAIRASADCNFSNQIQCDNFEDIALYKTSYKWTNLIIQNDNYEIPARKLQSETFKLTPNLTELHIISKLTNMAVGVFKDLDNLVVLVLFKNKLPHLKSGWFANLKHIINLDLRQNEILSMETDTFKDSAITQINLSNNNLSRIYTNVLQLPGLKKLLLSHNQLIQIAEQVFHPDLEYLDLSANRLSVFGLDVFNQLKKLSVLLLNNNRIKSVVAFPNVTSLVRLDLSYNSIEVIEEGAFVHYPHLSELQLQCNKLVYLNPKSFPLHSPLVKLYLARNWLPFIPDEMAHVLHKVKSMTLGGNPWPCVCLTPVLGFIKQQGVVLEECDRKFFDDGINPICLTTDSKVCNGTELDYIIKTDMNNVHALAEGYKC